MLLLGMTSVAVAQDDADVSAAKMYNNGLEDLKAKDYEAAFEKMAKAIDAADPENETDAKVIQLASKNGAIAAYYAGTKMRKADRLDDALATFKRGTEMNENFYANYTGYARVLDSQDNVEEAIPAFLEAANVAAKSEKTAEKAEKYMNKAANYAGVAYGNKQYEEAVTYADIFLENSDGNADVYYYKASSLRKLGKNDEAMEAVAAAIPLLPEGEDNGKYYMLKGNIHADMGQASAAKEAYGMVKEGKYYDRAQYRIKELNR